MFRGVEDAGFWGGGRKDVGRGSSGGRRFFESIDGRPVGVSARRFERKRGQEPTVIHNGGGGGVGNRGEGVTRVLLAFIKTTVEIRSHKQRTRGRREIFFFGERTRLRPQTRRNQIRTVSKRQFKWLFKPIGGVRLLR